MELSLAIVLFLAATLVIAVAGTKLTRTADQMADLTGWGEALFGAIFLGGTTSLPGIVTSVVAAYNGHPQLAISNAIGGIAAQTLFLSIADISYRKTNLEHAAASFANLMQGLLLIGLLSFVLIGVSGPELTVWNVHPLSIAMIILYLAASRLISKAKDRPMWSPRITLATVQDIPDRKNIENLSLRRVTFKFIMLAVVVGAAGYVVAKSGIAIANQTGLSETMIGVLFTAISTSLPELIVSLAAVRQKALTLSVGNIIGGNTFDVLFVAFADIAYNKGSILHAIASDQIYVVALTMMMTSILILGLLHREREGIGKIGWESLMIILVYLAGNAYLFL
ncbi:MAG: sodium:calcium antiporter [Bacteroidales bacterium]|nr:sodium:calcium antiporter [Bacteroidales bacterium]